MADALNFGASVGITTHLDQGSFHFPQSYFGYAGEIAPFPDFFVGPLASFDQYRAFDSVRALHAEGAMPARVQINYLHFDTDADTPELRQRLLNTVPLLGDKWLSNGGIGEFTSKPPLFSASPDTGPVGQNATRLVAQHGWRNENHSLTGTDFADVLDMWDQVNTELKTTGIPQTPSDPDPAKGAVVNEDGITKLRWVLAHVPFINEKYINQTKKLGVGLSLLSWRWLAGTPNSNGPPFKTILRLGARAGMSSDGMQINVMDPWTAMTTR